MTASLDGDEGFPRCPDRAHEISRKARWRGEVLGALHHEHWDREVTAERFRVERIDLRDQVS